MPKSAGLRVSVIGALVFMPSLLSLLVLPDVVSIAGMVTGGMLVWIGFMMTLLAYYGGGAGKGDRED